MKNKNKKINIAKMKNNVLLKNIDANRIAGMDNPNNIKFNVLFSSIKRIIEYSIKDTKIFHTADYKKLNLVNGIPNKSILAGHQRVLA